MQRGRNIISDYNVEEIDETFYEKELQITNKTEFRIEKVIKRKVVSDMTNGKDKKDIVIQNEFLAIWPQ